MAVSTLLAAGLRLFSSRSDAKTVEFVALAAWTAGQFVQLNTGLVGIVSRNVAIGETAVVIYEAEDIEVTCVAANGADFLVGSKVYFDIADAEVNQVTLGNYYCGTVNIQPANLAEKVRISLNGQLALGAGLV